MEGSSSQNKDQTSEGSDGNTETAVNQEYKYRVAQQHKFESAAESYRRNTDECCWESHRQLIFAASVLLAATGAFFTQSDGFSSLSLFVRLLILASWVLYLGSMGVGCWFFRSEENFYTGWSELSSDIAAKYSDISIPVAENTKDAIARWSKMPSKSRRGIGVLQAILFVAGGCADVLVFAMLVFHK
jgi:hypothetical protein